MFRRGGAARLAGPLPPGPCGVGGGSRLALCGNVAGTDRGAELLKLIGAVVDLVEVLDKTRGLLIHH